MILMLGGVPLSSTMLNLAEMSASWAYKTLVSIAPARFQLNFADRDQQTVLHLGKQW